MSAEKWESVTWDWIYGREAEAMLSQPRTKIFTRTTEPRTAEWVSKCIGDVKSSISAKAGAVANGGSSRVIVPQSIGGLKLPFSHQR